MYLLVHILRNQRNMLRWNKAINRVIIHINPTLLVAGIMPTLQDGEFTTYKALLDLSPSD